MHVVGHLVKKEFCWVFVLANVPNVVIILKLLVEVLGK